MKLIWPFYIYPEPGSPAVVALRENIASIWGVVVNVNSGPGPSERDANYVELIAWLQQQHVYVFGYISSRYGDRPIDECSADIRAWKTTWGITSIFVDEANSFAEKLPFYETLRTVISGLCILNHGVVPVSSYLGCGDILCTSETTWENLKGDVFPEWCKQNRSRLYHIIGGLPADQIALALKSSNETADYIFASNFTEPEAYERLPTYWLRLLGQIQMYATPPSEATPAPLPAPLNTPENQAVMILIEVMSALQAASESTLKSAPWLVKQRMEEIAQLKSEVARLTTQGSLRLAAADDDQIIEDLKRRLANRRTI